MEPQEAIHVHLHIGADHGSRFAEFWNGEHHAGNLPEGAAGTAEFRHAKRPLGGLGLAVPPEVVIAFLKGVGTAAGSGVGALLWKKLQEYFSSQPPPQPASQTIVIVLPERTVETTMEQLLSSPPPEELRRL
jgi:hypothetical protein